MDKQDKQERPLMRGVYTVTARGDRSYWTKIGAAFANADGSLTVRLDAHPVSGVLVIRAEEPAQKGGA